VDNGDIVSAEQSYQNYTSEGRSSVGVLAVTVGECQQMNLDVEDDCIQKPPAHALIVFCGLSRKKREDYAKILRDKARKRGWKFGPIP